MAQPSQRHMHTAQMGPHTTPTGVLGLQESSLDQMPSHGTHPAPLTFGPKPHFRGYVSLSMITRLILATMPWSQVDITAVVMSAMAVRDKFREWL